MARVMEMSTPFGPDVLMFRSMSTQEELGRLFEYQIEALSERGDLDPDEILGQSVTVRLELAAGESQRHFNGIVTRFGVAGHRGRFHRYRLTVRPWLWLLTRSSDCRIFQEKSVIEIIEEIFHEYPDANYDVTRLIESYEPREYCVQYRESDFNFVSRLLEQEGIYYYFQHEDGKHKMVLVDSMGAHRKVPGYESIPFIPHDRGGRLDQEYIAEWHVSREVRPGAYMLADFNFLKPSTPLRPVKTQARGHKEAQREVYDYPGLFQENAEGEHYVQVRMEEESARHVLVQGTSNARGLATGHVFQPTGLLQDDTKSQFLVVSTSLEMEFNEYESQEEMGADFRCSFTALPTTEVYRPPRFTPRPFVQGVQTAVVVGPAGDEIFTDKYGRVKVQFHWDREGRKDQNSSCFVRVSHPWAGKNFGFIAIPRIGQEVIVDFLEGDPDRPIITGRVYNAEQMPPWELPEHKTRTGLVTRSSTGGSPSNANELRFEDKKGEEEVFLHAERNLTTTVENDEYREVGHDRKTLIKNDETLDVDGKRTTTVKGDESLEVEEGDRTMKVTSDTEEVQGDESLTVHGARTVTIDQGETRTINAGGLAETIIGPVSQTITGSYEQSATQGMELTTPLGVGVTAGTTINLTATGGITLQTPVSITLQAAAVDKKTPNYYENALYYLGNTAFKQEQIGAVESNYGLDIATKQIELAVKTMAKDKVLFFQKEATTQVTNINVEMNVLSVQMTKSTIVIFS
jgi:type VI secretion system secreted protein VgrG